MPPSAPPDTMLCTAERVSSAFIIAFWGSRGVLAAVLLFYIQSANAVRVVATATEQYTSIVRRCERVPQSSGFVDF